MIFKQNAVIKAVQSRSAILGGNRWHLKADGTKGTVSPEETAQPAAVAKADEDAQSSVYVQVSTSRLALS